MDADKRPHHPTPPYIVSSSISPTDMFHATEYPLVQGYLTKPLDKAKIDGILSNAKL